MIRSNGRYFDFNGDIEMERRVKLFEEIDETLGDFSYEFELPRTGNNYAIFGFPTPDAIKSIYRFVAAEICDDDGIPIYVGQIKLGRVTDTVIYCSFFSGNFNWLTLLSGPLTGPESGLSFSELDTELTETNIANSWDNDDGIIFPIIDTGGLATRSFQSLMIDDFTGCIFVKYIFNKVFQKANVKLQGDFFDSPIYNSLILSRNTKSQEDIDARSFFAGGSTDQSYDISGGIDSQRVFFDDDFTFPFFDGSQNNYDPVPSRYTADVKMRVNIDVSLGTIIAPASIGTYVFFVELRVNNVQVGPRPVIQTSGGVISIPTISITTTLEAGDFVDVTIVTTNASDETGIIIQEGRTFRIVPTFIFSTSGDSLLPKWTKAELVSNIFAIFCCICDYDPFSKTLTVDFFENIKQKEPVDLSNKISIYEYDHQEFISDFSKKNRLSYQEAEIEEIEGYNTAEFVKYGAGEITVDNDFITDSGDILTSDFSAPISYINNAFAASLERVKFIELADISTESFDTVSDAVGSARFNGLDDTLYRVGELVRVSGSTNSAYNGEYVIASMGTAYITLEGLTFNTDATGNITRIAHEVSTDDNVYLFWQTEYDVDSVSKFSRIQYYYIKGNQYPNVAYPYFNMLSVGKEFNDLYKQSLSFGRVSNPLSYQRTILEKYWGIVGRVLNDPMKLKCYAHLSRVDFMGLSPLNPIRIKDVSTDNLYYLNSIEGYKNSYQPCNVELIKLS